MGCVPRDMQCTAVHPSITSCIRLHRHDLFVLFKSAAPSQSVSWRHVTPETPPVVGCVPEPALVTGQDQIRSCPTGRLMCGQLAGCFVNPPRPFVSCGTCLRHPCWFIQLLTHILINACCRALHTARQSLSTYTHAPVSSVSACRHVAVSV